MSHELPCFVSFVVYDQLSKFDFLEISKVIFLRFESFILKLWANCIICFYFLNFSLFYVDNLSSKLHRSFDPLREVYHGFYGTSDCDEIYVTAFRPINVTHHGLTTGGYGGNASGRQTRGGATVAPGLVFLQPKWYLRKTKMTRLTVDRSDEIKNTLTKFLISWCCLNLLRSKLIEMKSVRELIRQVSILFLNFNCQMGDAKRGKEYRLVRYNA